jgi:hypothetical protein
VSDLVDEIRRDDQRREQIMDSISRRHPSLWEPGVRALHARPWLWRESELQIVASSQDAVSECRQ